MAMSALELLKEYGSDVSEKDSEEEFIGFDDEPGGYNLPLKKFLLNKYGEEVIQTPNGNSADETESAEKCSTSEEEVLDSDGSFLEIQTRKRKRTKKEILKAKIAKNRRLAHKLIIEKCGCKKNCDQIVSKDERVIIHDQFWKLDKTGQTNYIRGTVH